MFKFLDTLFIGVTSGAIYSLMAISIVLVWRSSRIVNFAQAGLALLSAYIGFELLDLVGSFWLALPLAMVVGALTSSLVEIFLVRTLIKHGRASAIASVTPIIATLGLLGIVRSGIGMIWGSQDKVVESPVSVVGYEFSGHTFSISPMKALILVSVLVLVLILSFIFQKTNLGLALRATAFSPEISRLAGVRVDWVRTTGWAIAGATGAAAGMLHAANDTAPLTPESLSFSLLLVFGFIAASIGGLDSLVGAAIGAQVLGLFLAFISTYVNSTVVFLSAFFLLIIVLLIRPEGLFSSKGVRRA